MTAPPHEARGRGVPRDPGLQPERTALAWRRTLLALVVADFFIWRSWLTALAHQDGPVAGSALGLGLAASGAAVATMVICFCIVYRARHPSASAPTVLLMRAASASTSVLALSVIASIVFSA